MALADPPVTYRAFISYSHRDAAFARRLHRQLESYRLPAKLVGSETARGIVPERLSPIFRDREELSAGESLSDQVLAALAASAALIIICSPNAKASVWVGKEIENFRLLHPNRPVLAALIDGEPDEAFPPALTQIDPELGQDQVREPIAADFRKGKGKDGHRLARLKLAAGLTGVALDALVQRDAQRQFRRVMAITVAAVVALLVMAGLLVMALQARQEADRQREEAEGLVEYMLTDLRDKLKGVGNIDVMTAVNERAMAYYGDRGDLASLPAASLERRARIVGAMGEDEENRGNLSSALQKYLELHRTTATLLESKPYDAERLYSHASSENRLALLANVKKDYATALDRFLRSRNLLNRIKEPIEQNTDWVRLSSYVSGNICATLISKNNIRYKPLPFCEEAVRRSEYLFKLDRSNHMNQYDLVFHYMWLSDALALDNNINKSLAMESKSAYLSNNLNSKNINNSLFQEQQMEIYFKIAKRYKRENRFNLYSSYLKSIRKINNALIARDNSNKKWNSYKKQISELERKY